MKPDDENQQGFGSAGYVRRLRRYEAAPTVCARAGTGESAMEFYSPFGPLIAKTHLPPALVERLNAYADGVADEQGAPPGELTLPERFVREGGDASLAELTARRIAQYAGLADDRDVGRVRFESFWMVSHFPGTFSPVHFHSGDISGVAYLKVPVHIANEEIEEQQSYINARRAGYITFLIGGKQRFSKSLISFKPQVGDLYVFPGWLLHAVEPFQGEGERRSISFNAFVE
ncbi:MAG: hypothetical protein A3H91_09235 [Gammaproteobacteria bacterium RIFCSPLOWO2_02_FULL_61_13]|nr:MAG: hypothetical protein A3H91_09235 [Gammaproteobacteria bacterium RIFCSPLOWO2_02_FULL_61_13]